MGRKGEGGGHREGEGRGDRKGEGTVKEVKVSERVEKP